MIDSIRTAESGEPIAESGDLLLAAFGASLSAHSSGLSAPTERIPLPPPRIPISIRPGTLDDVPFMDSLQKIHTKQVGWMPTAQFEGKIKLGHVLVAESAESVKPIADSEDSGLSAFSSRLSAPLGYLIGNDQYFKRDDVGIIYQLNVSPGKQRALVGAALLSAQFQRSAWGCRLYCCWCAQDLAANKFWEAMGFVPLAFRTGSRTKGDGGAPRVHIFWEKRIRAGDETTPWWYPSQTGGGSIREDRLVLPIPPGTHWSDAKPLVLPAPSAAEGPGISSLPAREPLRLPGKRARKPVARVVNPRSISAGGMWFAPTEPQPAAPEAPKKKREKAKNDPKLVAAARELRDRWLEQMNKAPLLCRGKYDVSRVIEDRSRRETAPPMLLAA